MGVVGRRGEGLITGEGRRGLVGDPAASFAYSEEAFNIRKRGSSLGFLNCLLSDLHPARVRDTAMKRAEVWERCGGGGGRDEG